ncbi:MAG TPA: tetratricopeptide repeat protein [Blastocatellia bacterium]|nr:tetratricopeptide repeat protein [Blastocatellia bacterium]
MLRKTVFLPVLLLGIASVAAAQDVEVDRYNVNARVDLAQNALDVRSGLTITNLAQTAKPKLYFRLAKSAKLSAATVGGAPAQFELVEDRLVTTLNQLTLTPKTSLAPGANTDVEVTYRIEAPETSPLLAVYPGEVLVVPEVTWVPMPWTHFTRYGPTTAPFTMSVTVPAGFRAGAPGLIKSDANQTFVFEQPLNSLPFFVAGTYDPPVAAEHGGVKLEVLTQTGLVSVASDGAGSGGGSSPAAGTGSQPARMLDECGRVIDFLTRILGPPTPGTSLRIISSVRAGNISVPGALVLNEQVFRQDSLDATTIELLADALARTWVGGRVRVRGHEARSAQPDRPGQKALTWAILGESVPRHLAALYFGERFGPAAATDEFARMRAAYTPVAQSRSDAELCVQTILIPRYSAAILNKGPLVLRLIAATVGQDKYLATLRSVLSGGQSKVVTFDDIRNALVAGSADVSKLFAQWIDSIIEPDIVIGVPQPTDRPGVQRVNLRNLGTGDVAVQVLAVTASGKRIVGSVTVPSEDLTSLDIPTGEKIASVEADPDKLIIQTNYDNDAKPVVTSALTLFNDAITAFNKGEHAQAESRLKEALRTEPKNPLLWSWLARALAAQNKADEALKAADNAVNATPHVTSATAWARITQGQIALAKNTPAAAVDPLRHAALEAVEAPAQYAARDALIKAERAANKLPGVDETIKSFISQFDLLIKQPSSDKLFGVVMKVNLKRFVQGLTVAPPQAWSTEVLRVDRVDANRIAVDVSLTVRADNKDQSGTAVFVLFKTGTGWMLEDVKRFNVK